MKKYLAPILFLASLFSFGQKNISTVGAEQSQTSERGKIGLQELDNRWKLEVKNYTDSHGRNIIDTAYYYQSVHIIEHWIRGERDHLKINKIIQYNSSDRKIMFETDIYKKYLPDELMAELQLQYNYDTKDFSATIDTTLNEEKFAENKAALNFKIEAEGDYYSCGTAYVNLLYSGYKPTTPAKITEAEARQLINEWVKKK